MTDAEIETLWNRLAQKISLTRCFFSIAFPEKRCPKEGRWHDPTIPLSPADKFVWCDEHRHNDDVLINNPHHTSAYHSGSVEFGCPGLVS